MEIIKSIFIILASITITVLGSWFYTDIPKYQKQEREGESENQNIEKELIIYKKPKKYIIVSITCNVIISFMYIFLYKQNLLINNIKTLTVLAILWPIAYYDYKFLKIPNHIIKYAVLIRALEAVPEIIIYKQVFLTLLLDTLITTVILFIVCFICNFISKSAIGMGDIKMLLVLGLFLGGGRTFTAMMLSLMAAFFSALYLLISGKKGKKDIIPFAPSVLAGTFLAAFVIGI